MSKDQDEKKTELFTISKPEFDESTYWGRFEAFRAVANPLHAFYTNSRVLQMQKIIKEQNDAEQSQFDTTGDRQVRLTQDQIKKLRIAETVVSTAIHPDTGDLLPWGQRFSSFLPINIPIGYMLIMLPPTPFNTILGQWINQTYNAWLNYGNRNASSVYTNQDIAKSYSAACTASIAISLSVRYALSGVTARSTGAKLICINSVSAFMACASAGYLNAYLMRQTEMQKGIDVFHPKTGEAIECEIKSKLAAKRAVEQTAISRIMLNVTILLPPMLLISLEKARLMPKNKYLVEFVNFTVLLIELYFAVPTGIAMFPVKGVIEATDLEPEYQAIKDKVTGEMIKEFHFNKGL